MTSSRAVVKQLDHIVARVDDPRAVFDVSDSNSIQSLALSVSSLERAETHLRERAMIGTVTDDELTINPAKLEGLLVRLVQQEGGGYEGSRRY